MSAAPPPNEALAELVALLGPDDARALARTFLREFPIQLSELQAADRRQRHRLAHSMKSNSRLMGGHELSRHMASLEARLSADDGGDLTPEDVAFISTHFEMLAAPLRSFASL